MLVLGLGLALKPAGLGLSLGDIIIRPRPLLDFGLGSMCGSMVNIQSATAEIRRGIKKEDRR